MKKIVLYYLIAGLFIIGCGGGGGDSSSQSSTWGGKVNGAGYPDVAGNYSFITDTISYTCNNGESGKSAPVALNFAITQTDNRLVAKGLSPVEIPGVTIIQSNDMAGNIEKTGSFIMNRMIIMTINTMPGTNTISFNLNGQFTTSGWGGDYTFVQFNNYYNLTCNSRTTFKGDYVSPNMSMESGSINQSGDKSTEAKLEGTIDDFKYLLGH